jgi:hypothetical protein
MMKTCQKSIKQSTQKSGRVFDWGPLAIFVEHWGTHYMSTSLDPKSQNRNNSAHAIDHLFSLYTWELNFGQTIWDKSEVLLGRSWRRIWEPCENMMRTHWEQGKWIPPPWAAPPRRTKTGPLMSAYWAFSLVAWNFYFPKLFVATFGLG